MKILTRTIKSPPRNPLTLQHTLQEEMADDSCSIHGPLYGDDICAACHWSYKDSCCFRGTCQGCHENEPNQMAHMGPGGCLAEAEEEEIYPIDGFKGLSDETLLEIKKKALERIDSSSADADAEARYLAAEHVLESRQLTHLENDPLTVARDEVDRLQEGMNVLMEDYEDERSRFKKKWRRLSAVGKKMSQEEEKDHDETLEDIERLLGEVAKDLEEAEHELGTLEGKLGQRGK